MDISGTGYLTSYTYDMANHTVTTTQGVQNRIFQTDAAGRTIYTSEPERGITNYSYSYGNSTGLLVTRTRPRANQYSGTALTTTTTQYDKLGRVISVSYDDGTPNKSYSYDTVATGQGWTATAANGKGRLVSTTSGSGTTLTRSLFSYDTAGNINYLWRCAPSICGGSNQESRNEAFGYDLGGGLVNLYDPVSGPIYYGLSPQEKTLYIINAASNATNPQVVVSNLQNGVSGPTHYSLGNNLDIVKRYDSMARNDQNFVCQGSASLDCTGGTQLYGNYQYYGGTQSRGGCDTILGQCQFNFYDEFGRLGTINQQQHGPGAPGSYTYSYDRWGNRTQQSSVQGGPSPNYSFNSYNNRIIGFTYDDAGNMTLDNGSVGSHSYTYDAEGNVVDVDGGSTAHYVYDAFNQRVRAQAGGSTNEYLYDFAGRRMSTWDATYNNGTEGRIYMDGKQIAFKASNGQMYFDHNDFVGTERMRTDYQGNPAVTYMSLAFGDGFVPTVSAAGSTQDNLQFAGLEGDSESGTGHAQFRQYSSRQGRWMSPDPYSGSYDLSNPQTLNRYVYTRNSPFSYTDSTGLSDCESGYAALPGGESCIFDATRDYGGSTTVYDTLAGNYLDADIIGGSYFSLGNNDSSGGGSSESAPNSGNPISPACQATLLGMMNQQLGTSFTDANVAGGYYNGTAANLIIEARNLPASQFDAIQQGRFTTYSGQALFGFGMAGHLTAEPQFPGSYVATTISINGGVATGNFVHFPFHDDHGYAGNGLFRNPLGAAQHFITDVLGHNRRKPC